jgi:hypothetical protein
MWVASCGIEDMAAKAPGWRRGSKPRSREAVRLSAQGFTRDDGPVRLNADGEFRTRLFGRQRSGAMIAPGVLSESAIDFVADGADNAGHRGALGVALGSVQPGWMWGCGDGDIERRF